MYPREIPSEKKEYTIDIVKEIRDHLKYIRESIQFKDETNYR